MKLDMGKLGIPQTDDPLCRPNVRPGTHADTELIEAVMNRLPQLPLHRLSHLCAMERERFGTERLGANANNAARRMRKVHCNPSKMWYS